MKKLKIGVLSTAQIGKEQVIPAIGRAENAEVVAIASRHADKANEAAKELGIKTSYDTYEALLQDQEIDAVYIPLPNSLHKEWVRKAAEHGKHILCEKPVALNKEELAEMVEVTKKHDVYFMEAFMYQFHPQHLKVKELIEAGEIGDISYMDASFSFFLDDGENIRLNADLGGGAIYDVGCYTLHTIRNILNEEPVKVYANARIDSTFGVDTTTAGVLSFKDGIQASFNASFDIMARQSYEVIGSAGKIVVSAAYRPDINEDMAGKITVVKENGEETEYNVPGDQYALMIEDFADAILYDRELYYSVEKMQAQMEVVDAVLTSIKSGDPVKLG
ncbi:Gfo/Idh/MocA family protein [Saliterribacillus persicus]|uniref:Putative dehydrogenase n=1 Tax=Saliterribacillus persicus TaxID=930114 RepID=A0A368Y3I5_9BACI|nr:Gfo/Idh/MocA family oxidoreductase [Saliterribacillus persicus]RCW74742.1 putative dehydrogenase [Saliterribacillus persicus]